MEYLFLVLLILILTILIFILLKKDNTNTDKLNLQQKNNFLEFKSEISEYLNIKFKDLFHENKENEKSLRESLEKFLNNMSEKVDKKLDSGFKKTNETFAKIIERMAKIDQAQKNIEKLSNEVVDLQNVLTDSKSRGIFGEVQLDNILANIFGEDNKKFYEMQYHFQDTGVIVDCVVKTSDGLIPIDAKFPLTNFQKILDNKDDKVKQKQSEKLFKDGVKKQIDDISSKYIIENTTINTAFMFIPAESVFAKIHTDYFDIIEYAHKKNVNIVSPTTLMAMLTIVLIAKKSYETQKQAKVIQKELGLLSTEFERFTRRRSKFTKDFNSVGKDIEDIDITSNKIIRKFDQIEKLEFDEKEKNQLN